MTDRELLELAAKAAGMPGKWDENDDGWFVPYEGDGFISLIRWDPLIRDGDALRLAVKLNLRIAVREFRAEVFHQRMLDPAVDILGFELSEPIIKLLAKEDHDSDAYAATRRAIVRAAAEIGKGME